MVKRKENIFISITTWHHQASVLVAANLLSVQIYILLTNVYFIAENDDDATHDQSIYCFQPRNKFIFVYNFQSKLDEYEISIENSVRASSCLCRYANKILLGRSFLIAWRLFWTSRQASQIPNHSDVSKLPSCCGRRRERNCDASRLHAQRKCWENKLLEID